MLWIEDVDVNKFIIIDDGERRSVPRMKWRGSFRRAGLLEDGTQH